MPSRRIVASLGCFVALTGCSGSPAPSPAPPPASAPTWYKDVEPIVEVNCDGCHVAGGIGGITFDATTVQSAAGLMKARVESGFMPPWPPSTVGPSLVGERRLTQEQMATVVAWVDRGAPLGNPADHQNLSPTVTFDPGRPADIVAMMGPTDAYPPHVVQQDDVRCFVIDLANPSNEWVTALQWVVGSPGAIHHIGGMAVDAQQAAAARALYGKDDRPGYDCAGGLRVGGVAGFSASGAGSDTGTVLPDGSGLFVPAGGSVILSVHYVPQNLTAPDLSGVRLWFASSGAGLRPLAQYTFGAPSELPCPTGVTTDPNDACSRQYGINQVQNTTPSKTLATNDFLLAKCGTTLDQYYATLSFNPPDPSRFVIPTQCDDASPYDGSMQVVHVHMHTRGASGRISLQADDGTWTPLLDIPDWRWTWEGAYSLEQPVAVKAGQKLRLTCTYDNGTANQWSAATNQPGHDGPAAAPLQPPHYVVAGPERGDDMCAAFLTFEPAAYKNETYADVCHEAQAIYDDACTDHAVDFLASPCTAVNEQYAVQLVVTPPAQRYPIWCGPKGPGASAGATCDLIMNCALACAATMGLSNGIPATCTSACESNVNAYGPGAGQAAKAGSPLGDFRYANLAMCSQSACAATTTWQDYLRCAGVACTQLAEECYPTAQ